MGHNKYTITIALDMRKAFDTVNIHKLINKLTYINLYLTS